MATPATAVDTALSTILQQLGPLQTDPAVGMDVISRLSQQATELRIWIDEANAFGHHATTIALVKRMVAYGFTAPIRILLTSEADASKLEVLLPGYKAGAQTLTYRGVQLLFSFTTTRPTAPATLLLSGGSDAKEEELVERLDAVNCTYYLQLQPWNWKKPDVLIYRGQSQSPTVVQLDNQATLPRLSFHAYAEPAATRDDSTWDLYAALPRFTKRVAQAKLLADAAPGKYVMPVYGLERMNMWGALLTLVLGALAAQDQMPRRSRPIPVQPIVLLVFNRVSDSEGSSWSLLEQWLDGTASGDEYPEALKEYVTTNQLFKRLAFNYKEDEKPSLLSDQLRLTTGNRVLVVAMDGTPDEIFRYFYSTATLPFVFEGRGTQNLALNLGRPYLCTEPTSYPSVFFDDSTPAAPARARDAARGLNVLYSAYENADTAAWPSATFATALCDVMQDQAGLAYYQSLAAVYGAQPCDKLRMALRFLRTIPGFPA